MLYTFCKKSVSRILRLTTPYTILDGPTEPENCGFTVFVIVYFFKCGIMDTKLKIV
jgi:hypothetical protein